jgi:hypothetical protein
LLLVSFKSFSQADTIKKIVLDESVARAIIKDIIKGDLCKQKLILKDEEIKNLQEQNDELSDIIKIKDSMLSKKDEIITIQDKAIGWWKKPKLSGYLGTRVISNNITAPCVSATAVLSFNKINAGIQYIMQPNNPSMYVIIVEYKLF